MSEAEVERIVVRVVGDGRSFQQMERQINTGMKEIQGQAKQTKDAMVSFGGTIDNLGARVSNVAGQFRAMAALGSPWEQLTRGVGLASEAERMETNLATMVGSVRKAKMLMADMQKFAAETPMELPGISQAANLLLQFQTPIEEVIPLMRQLGDAAMGDAGRFQRIALAFGQMTSAGRVTREELGQMREAGFNPTQEIAKVMGISMAELNDRFEKGAVPLTAFRQALTNVTSEGGKFNNGMANASRTLSGLWSTMNDDVNAFQRSIGVLVIEEFNLKEVVKGVSNAAQQTTAAVQSMNPTVMAITTAVVISTAAFGTLVVSWKVGTIMVGLLITTTRNFIGSVVWATKSTWEWATALTGTSAAARVAAANAGMMGMAVQTSTTRMRGAAVAAGALKLALAAAVVYGASQLIQQLPFMSKRLDEFQARIDQVRREAARGGGLTANLGEGAVRRVEDSGRGDERAAAITTETAAIEEQMTQLRNWKESQEQFLNRGGMEAHAERINAWLGSMVGLQTESAAAAEAARLDISGTADRLATLEATMARLNELGRQNATAAADPAVVKRGTDLIKNLRTQIETIGMTADQAMIYKAAEQGLTQAHRQEAEALLELKKAYDAINGVREMNKELEEHLQTLGLTADEVKLLRMEREGANATDVRTARALIGMNQDMERHNNLLKEAQQVADKYATAEERYGKEMGELNRLYAERVISEELYIRATNQIAQKLAEEQAQAEKTAAAHEKLDSVLTNSAAGRARIREYLDTTFGDGSFAAGSAPMPQARGQRPLPVDARHRPGGDVSLPGQPTRDREQELLRGIITAITDLADRGVTVVTSGLNE